MRSAKFISLFIAILAFLSCSQEGIDARESDLFDRFIEQEAIALRGFNVQKEINLNGESESLEFEPDWIEELDFLNDYASAYRKHPDFQEFLQGSRYPSDSLVVELNSSEKFVLRFQDNQINEIEISSTRESLFNSSFTLVSYRSKKGYTLYESNKTLLLFENDLRINSTFKPG